MLFFFLHLFSYLHTMCLVTLLVTVCGKALESSGFGVFNKWGLTYSRKAMQLH